MFDLGHAYPGDAITLLQEATHWKLVVQIATIGWMGTFCKPVAPRFHELHDFQRA
jgi:hypothetical protein